MIKIKCAVCGKEIVNPILSQKTCSGKCSRAYQKVYQKTDKYKAYKKAYQKTDKYKAYKKVYNKAYQKTDKYKAYQKAYYLKKKQEKN